MRYFGFFNVRINIDTANRQTYCSVKTLLVDDQAVILFFLVLQYPEWYFIKNEGILSLKGTGQFLQLEHPLRNAITFRCSVLW